MKLGLLDRPKPFEDGRGVIRIDGRELVVIDMDSGERVSNITTMAWGPLADQLSESIFTPEHFAAAPDADYLVLVVRCDGAVRL